MRGFKKCCTSSAGDNTDGDMLWNGIAEDGNVRIECEGDEGTGCGDGDILGLSVREMKALAVEMETF